jgi:hypothetical protein
MTGDLGDFLAEGGALVGGAAALGATLGFIAGSLVHDFRADTDPEYWARRGGFLGGVVGLVVLLDRGVDFAA